MADKDYLTIPRHISRKQLIRLFSKIAVDRATGCWNWTAGIGRGGYGKTNFGSEFMTSHRLMYAWLVEPIPKGWKIKTLDHLCKNRKCCNPAHLELVTIQENVLRGDGPPAMFARSTHCKRGHQLTVVGKRRRCLICHTKAQHDNYVRKYTGETRERMRKESRERRRKRMNGPDREKCLAAQRAWYYRNKLKLQQHKDS